MIYRILNLICMPIAFILILATYTIYPIISYIIGRGFKYYIEEFLTDYIELMYKSGSVKTIQSILKLIIYGRK